MTEKKHKSYKKQVTFWRANAALISVIFHLILFISAGSIIAIKWMEKPEAEFTGKQAERPALPRRRLQLPVNVQKLQKKTRRPQVTTRMSTKGPADLALPDVDIPDDMDEMGFDRNVAVGSGRGLGNMGNAGSLGFGISGVNFFGLKSKGEKIMFLVDLSDRMMTDSKGGLHAFGIVKDEIKKRVQQMSAATLFNVVMFDRHKLKLFKQSMVPANLANAEKLAKWIEPFNSTIRHRGLHGNNYSPKSSPKPISSGHIRHWLRAVQASMEQCPDNIFILTGWWGRYIKKGREGFESESARKAWLKKHGWDAERLAKHARKVKVAKEKAHRILKKENEIRKKNGLPPKIGGTNWRQILQAAGEKTPAKLPHRGRTLFGPPAVIGTVKNMIRINYEKENLIPPRIHVAYLVGADKDISEKEEGRFDLLTETFDGHLRVLEGLESIEMHASAEMIEPVTTNQVSESSSP